MHPLRLYVFCTFFYFTLIFTVGSGGPATEMKDKRTFAQVMDSLKTAKSKPKTTAQKEQNKTDSLKNKGAADVGISLRKNGVEITTPGEIKNPLLKKFAEKLESFDETIINSKLLSYAPKFLFFILPVIALFLSLFYIRNKQFYFFNHFVYITHNHSFIFSWLFISTLITEVFHCSEIVENWIDGVIFLYAFISLFLSLKVVYGQSWFKTSLKFLLILASYLFLTVFSLLFLIVLVAVLN